MKQMVMVGFGMFQEVLAECSSCSGRGETESDETDSEGGMVLLLCCCSSPFSRCLSARSFALRIGSFRNGNGVVEGKKGSERERYRACTCVLFMQFASFLVVVLCPSLFLSCCFEVRLFALRIDALHATERAWSRKTKVSMPSSFRYGAMAMLRRRKRINREREGETTSSWGPEDEKKERCQGKQKPRCHHHTAMMTAGEGRKQVERE